MDELSQLIEEIKKDTQIDDMIGKLSSLRFLNYEYFRKTKNVTF